MLNARRAPFCSLVMLAAAVSAAKAWEKLDSSRATASADGAVLWYDFTELDIEGKGWSDTKASYDRLPAKAESMVRGPVWNLSRQSAGLCGRFVTDAPTISVRWSLLSANLAMPHMAATGVSGVDLYVKTDDGWRWLACGFPTAQNNEVALAPSLPAAEREYMLYLPLYNGVTKLEVGVPKEHTLAKAPARPADRAKPIVFYGTSITQGGCASRPGMVHTAILGRRLDRPIINLGFSGNGKMEPEMATLLAELDPAVYVLDCLPNMSPKEVSERVEPFVRTLRAARPSTPIVLVEDRNYTDGFLVVPKRERNEASHAALRASFDRLVADGVKDLYYLPAKDLLGDDGEATVDSSHPTDLGFVRQAAAFQSVLEAIDPKASESRPLTLEHAPEAPVVITRDVWAKLPRTSVKVPGPNGEETTYEGVAMAEVLKLVKAPLGKEQRGKMLAKFVLVTAADDYRVVFALPEIDPNSTADVVMVADRRDGEPLDAKEGPYRIIVPGEKKHGRWVRQVSRIAILAADEIDDPPNEKR